MIARRVTVQGRVQGVGFRAFVLMHAERLQLDGFVRNRKDGSVELVCAGEESDVFALIEQCRMGPPASRVESVDVQDAQGIVAKGFIQKPTV